MLASVVMVGLGGMLGAVMRFGIIHLVRDGMGYASPYGTLAVNVIGSFLIGVLTVLAAQGLHLSAQARLFLLPGMLGGFTTFSAFAMDSVTFFERAQHIEALAYIAASVLMSLLAAYSGMALMRGMLAS